MSTVQLEANASEQSNATPWAIKQKNTSNTIVLLSAGITLASAWIIVWLNTSRGEQMIDEYNLWKYALSKRHELVADQNILNELKKNPWATIEFNKKTNSWQIIYPLRGNKGGMKKLHTTQWKPHFVQEPWVVLPPTRTPGTWDSFNQKWITGNDELPTATMLSNPEHTGIITTEDDYSTFVRTLTTQVSIAMPDFITLKDRVWLKEWTEIKLIQYNDEVWVYWKIQENSSNQKYRLRIAVIDIKNRTLNSTILNSFYYIIEK